MTPAPAALRLVTSARNPAPERPPLGVAAWTTDATAVAILLDASIADLEEAAMVAAQIPPADRLAASTLVVVLGTAARSAGLWGRLLPSRRAKIGRAARTAALLAQGYVDIGAAYDAGTSADVVWGYAAAAAVS